MTDRLETGVVALDRKLGGGLPTGRVVVLTAPPASQSELLLSRLATGRRTTYLTGERRAAAVRRSLDANGVDIDDATIYDVGHETPALDAIRYVQASDPGDLFVVDPVDPLEATDRDHYREFLAALSARMETVGTTAVLYGLAGDVDSPARRLTTYHADVVLDLETTVEDGTVRNWLTVLKFRGGAAFEESLRLELTERIGVDTSRDIA